MGEEGQLTATKLATAVKYIRRELSLLDQDDFGIMEGNIRWGKLDDGIFKF